MDVTRPPTDGCPQLETMAATRQTLPHNPGELRRRPQKTFVSVNDFGDDTFNNSSCSSLTNDSDLDDNIEELILFFESPEPDQSLADTRKKSRKKKNKSVSYAQLLVDPETGDIFPVMEVACLDRVSVFNDHEDDGTIQSHTSISIETTSNESDRYKAIAMESRFRDLTMSTEQSSDDSGGNHREGPERDPRSIEKSNLRFPEEPVVFSHDGRSGQAWLDQNDLNLYLLHDSSDPWDLACDKPRCTETVKRLLNLRLFVSLSSVRHGTDSKKWRGIYSEKLTDSLAYSALNEM